MFISLEIIVGVVLVLLLLISLLSKNFLKKFSHQQAYYKSIIDTSTNIVLLSDQKSILSANRTFFNYFHEFDNISDFSEKHSCICEFFEVEDGYLSPLNDGVAWAEYLVTFQMIKHKIKMKIHDEIYYFLASASLIDEKKNIYALILSDITEQEITRHELVSLSIKDELTQIGNRKLYDDILSNQVILAQRYLHPFSLVILDIDFFKKVNDSLGHDVGDKVLKEYTHLIHDRLREVDTFCRIGGEEFVFILPHTTKDKAYQLAQKLRVLVEEHKQITPITMSFGVVEYVKGDDEESIFKRADKALYRAKESGRNKVILG